MLVRRGHLRSLPDSCDRFGCKPTDGKVYQTHNPTNGETIYVCGKCHTARGKWDYLNSNNMSKTYKAQEIMAGEL